MIDNGSQLQNKEDKNATVDDKWVDGLTILAKHSFTLNAGILLAFPAIFSIIHKSIANPGIYVVIGTAPVGVFLSLLGLITLHVLVHPNEKQLTMQTYGVARTATLASIVMGMLTMFAAVYAMLSTGGHAEYFVRTLLIFGSPVFIAVILALYLRHVNASH
jgi:hypothetical protein